MKCFVFYYIINMIGDAMNKKGIILSVYIYVLLVFFLLVIGSLLVVLNNTRILSDKIKEDAISAEDNMKYGFSINLSGAKTICQNFGISYAEPGFSAKDQNGNTLPVTVTSNVDIWKAGTYSVNYTAKYNNKEKTVTRQVIVINNDYKYNGSSQTFNVQCDGIYKIELWGASGGNTKYNLDGTGATVYGGTGAYTTGEVSLDSGNSIYIYVGGKGQDGGVLNGSQTIGGYNGGGNGMVARASEQNSGAGGGSTDIRLKSGSWSNSDSLKSRIMVAAGGAGASNWTNAVSGGYGGSLSGAVGNLNVGSVFNNVAIGGSQISGGAGGGSASGGLGSNGQFGIGGAANATHGSGGGSGYYGGGGGGYIANGVSSGSGGSSFISGYPGCNAIDINGNPTNQSIHYSGIQFDDAVVLDGSKSMVSPTGTTETGHSGNGYARITYLGTSDTVNDRDYEMKKFIAIGNNSGIKLRMQKPDKATTVMVRKKTTPWTSTDTTSTGTLVSDPATLTDADNTWYVDGTSTNGTTYYYKAFPQVNSQYKYIPYLNETSAVGGGLSGEYLMEENLNDTSGNGNTSNGSALITYSSGVSGRTALFSSSGSYIYSPVFLDSGTYSISTWAYSNGTFATQNFIFATAESGGNYLYQDANQTTYTLGTCFNGGYQYISIPATITNRWVNIVYVVNTTSNVVKVYYDGSLVSQVTYSGAYCPSTLSGSDKRSCIGCNPNASLASGNYFDGRIDQVRIYNRELLPDEVLSLYNE